MHENENVESENEREQRYEKRDVSYGPYAKWIAGLFLFTGISILSAWVVFKVMVRIAPAPAPNASSAISQELPPQPRLQAHPARDLILYTRAENSLLNSYGWINRKEGIVRIPVNLALDIIAKQGLPELSPALRPGATEKETYHK